MSPRVLGILCAVFSGCGGTPDGAPRRTLFVNGRVHLDSSVETVEALLVEEGLVIAAGAEHELRSRAAGAELVDLRGGVAVPGLIDAHAHLEGLGDALENLDLALVSSYAELVRRVAGEAERRPEGSWIRGRGWDQTRWTEGEFPHHRELSRAVPDHPVLLERVDGHAALANARALELAGLLTGEPFLIEDGIEGGVEGGRILSDEEGEPTGVLIDRAMLLVENAIPAPDRSTRERRILRAQQECLRLGLVGVHDMGISPESASVLEGLAGSGELRLRVVAYLSGNEGLPAEVLARYPREEDLDPAAWLRVVGVKFVVDGALGSWGAALLEPYSDERSTSGLPQMSEARFDELLSQATRSGLQPATHAIGDRANRMVLDAYERAQHKHPAFAGLRPRIEHAQVVAPEDWGRFASLAVIPSMQPTHATSDMRWAEARLGPERIAGAYAWRRLASPRSPLAFGSDFPVERVSPLEGLYAARTRMDREGSPPGGWRSDQALDPGGALAGFTSGAAYAAREEDRRGRLRPGYHADLTVLDVDPLTCEPNALLRAQVLMTVIDGEVVYERE